MLDLIMPGLAGHDALTDLRVRGFGQPVIVVTATGGIDTVVNAMQAGAQDFFVKPARQSGSWCRSTTRFTWAT